MALVSIGAALTLVEPLTERTGLVTGLVFGTALVWTFVLAVFAWPVFVLVPAETFLIEALAFESLTFESLTFESLTFETLGETLAETLVETLALETLIREEFPAADFAFLFLATTLFFVTVFFTPFFAVLAVFASFNLTRFLEDALTRLEMEAFFRGLVTALDLVAIGATLTLTFALVFGLLVSDSLIIELPN